MSYIKLTCPSCNNKHEVSLYYLRTNNIKSTEDLVKQICNCINILDVKDVDDIIKNKPIDNEIFKEIAKERFKYRTFLKGNDIAYSTYNYIPERTLEFKYQNEYDQAARRAEIHFKNDWNKKNLLLRFKCQENLKKSSFWSNEFSFVNRHEEDHDNSYVLLRAFKNRDKDYINFLSNALASVLKNTEITLCRIPSSEKDKENGCDDIINNICSSNNSLNNGSKCLRRFKSITPSHKGGVRSVELHLATSEVLNYELLNNKNVLLIDDIITTGKSAVAYSRLIKNKTKPLSLNILIFGKTIYSYG